MPSSQVLPEILLFHLKEDLVKVKKGSYNVQEVRADAFREEIKYLGLFSLENKVL